MEKDIENRDLSKVAIKGSAYNLFSLLITKFGGIILTIILARILLPELFGIYSLALSIITIIITFTDLGIDNTLLRYLSDSVGKRNKKLSSNYFKYIFKIKCYLILFSVILLLIISKYLSYSIYKNPLLFYPLLFSCLFIISESLRSFFGTVFIVKKDFKSCVYFDAFLQSLKIIFSVFAILVLSDSLKISGIFIAFFASNFLILFLMLFSILKKDKSTFLGKTGKFNKYRINSYWKCMVLSTVSLAFFASTDTLMLGKFVSPEYIGYYRAATSLVIAISSVFSLSWAFFPIFTQIKRERFQRGFNKVLRYILILLIPATVGMMFVGKYLIKIMYGNDYIFAAYPIYFLSLLILTAPPIGLYSIIFQAKEKPGIVNKSVLFSLIGNILLNILVIFLFKNNYLFIIAGVGLTTSLSRFILLGLLIFYAKKEFNFKITGIGLRSPIFSTLIMALFLFLFNYFIDINIFFGIIEILAAIIIYVSVLFLTNGLNKEDWTLIKNLKRK